jgi:hypothetical protein
MERTIELLFAFVFNAGWQTALLGGLPQKGTARKMIAMQRAINEQNFSGKLTVTCNSCHRGRSKPEATPDLENAGWKHPAAPAAPTTISGEEAVARLPRVAAEVTKRVVRGTVERDNGRDQPKKEAFVLTVEGGTLTYDTELSHPPEAKRALAMFVLEPLRPDQVPGERWLVTPERIRRYRQLATPLGILPEQIDYTDFRNTASGRLPFRAEWSRADYHVTYVVEEVQ